MIAALRDRQALLGREHRGLSFRHLGFDRDGVEAHEELAGFHEVALVHQNLLHTERLLGGDVQELRLEAAVAGDDPFRERGLLRLPVAKAEERRHADDDQRNDPLECLFRDLRHGWFLLPPFGRARFLLRSARLGQQVAPVRAILHFLLHSLGQEALAAAPLPASPERLVRRDPARRDGRAHLRQAILLLQERALRVEHALVVDRALSVLNERELFGAHGGFHCRFL